MDETTGSTLLVETGRAAVGEDFGSFPPLPVEVGTAGELEETSLRTPEETPVGRTVAVGSTTEEETDKTDEVGGTSEDEILLAFVPPSVTVI